MAIRIYHGSESIIEKPQFGLGKKYNDYGLGFYCTESIDMAREWAVSFERNGYANSYDLSLDGLDILNLGSDDYCILNWLAVLLENREFDMTSALSMEARDYLIKNFKVDYSDKDIIIGYRADDSYFSFAQDFLNGTISYRKLCNAMFLGELGQQIVLKSKRAFEQLNFVEAHLTLCEEWYLKKQQRDKKARSDYFDSRRMKREPGDLYIMQIIDEEMRADDLRLR